MLARRVADVVNAGDSRLPVQVADGAVCHGEFVVGQRQRVNLLLGRLLPPCILDLLPRVLNILGQAVGVVPAWIVMMKVKFKSYI